MSFDDKLINEINEKILLSDFIGRKVTISKRGREFVGLCPFHNEKTPSFTINDDKNFYHCFGCGAHGNVINFLMNDQNLEFREAIRYLCTELGLDFNQYSKNTSNYPSQEINIIKNILNLTKTFFVNNLISSKGGFVREYIKNRNISMDVCKRFNLGYSLKSSNDLIKHLMDNNFNEDFIIRSGVVGKSERNGQIYDFFRNRLMFPINDNQGNTIAFGGRTLEDSDPKYLNSPDTLLFKKRRTLYNYQLARNFSLKQSKSLIVVEGYLDVIALTQVGLFNVVAPLGTALSEEQLMLLWRTSDEPIICMDGDKAGYMSAVRTLSIAMPLLKPGKSLGFVFLPEGEDPDSLIYHNGNGEIENLLDRPISMFDFCWKIEFEHTKLNTPEKRAGFRSRFNKKISFIKDHEVRQEYQKTFNHNFSKYFSNHSSYSNRMFSSGKNHYYTGDIEKDLNMVHIARSNNRNNSFSREKNLIVAVINNPNLLNQIDEEFSKIPIVNKELNEIRLFLIDKFVKGERIKELDMNDWIKDKTMNKLLEEYFSGEFSKTNKLIPPYALKNEDLNFVEKGWREAADLQSIWYKRQNIKKLSKK